jgi:uncharacterized protein
MQTQTAQVGPVTLSERILFIDVLRGLALFGILTANMRAFNAPVDAYMHIGVLFHGRADVIAEGVVDAVFQGKFISIFSFLFGLGFAMQMSRAEARGVGFLSFYPRRLAALALFGIIHGMLIWSGDILFTYALSGTVLLFFRKRSQKTLLIWAGSLIATPIVVSTIFLGVYYSPFRPHWMAPKPVDMHKLHTIIDIYAHGSLWQIMVQNFVAWKNDLPTQAFAIYSSGLFMLGLWTWRQGIVQRLDDYAPILRRAAAWCLPLGFAGSLYVAICKAVIPPGTFTLPGWFAQVLWLPSSHVLAAGYMAGLALLFLKAPWRRLMLPFAAVGRMALTDYLMQSLLWTTFFYHYGTGLYGQVGPAVGFVIGIPFFAAQVLFSNWWLSRYRFGPMEWLWRGMTYGVFPAMRRQPQGALLPAE